MSMTDTFCSNQNLSPKLKGLDGGVPEPFLRAGAVLSRSMFLANRAAQLVSGFLQPHPYDSCGAARL